MEATDLAEGAPWSDCGGILRETSLGTLGVPYVSGSFGLLSSWTSSWRGHIRRAGLDGIIMQAPPT
eukprot:2041422-Amphidinium_carterae.1